MKTLPSLFILASVVSLTACISEEEKAQLEKAGVDINKLANQIIVTSPAADSEVRTAEVIVRADIPADVQAQSLALLIDGVEVGKDEDGAPWEISWPAYYWGDGNKHSLLLKTVTLDGVELRNQATAVSVSGAVAEYLSIIPTQGTLVYSSGAEVQLNLQPVAQAKQYEVSVNGQTIQVQDPIITLSELDVGSNAISYRAILDSPSAEVFAGPYSQTISIEVEKPVAPTGTKAVVEYTDTGYKATLSWNSIEEADEYQIRWLDATGFPSEFTTTDTEYVLEGLAPGSYKWSVRQKNTADHLSDYSDEQTANVGVFKTQLGGSGNDRASQIIASQAGGYLVRASTSSHEVTSTLQGIADDWIIRLNSQGSVTAQYIENKNGRDRYNNMFESSDGSVYLVGQDWDTQKALIMKLNSDLEPAWENEVLYRPEAVAERYDFTAVTEWNGKIYVSAVEWVRNGSSSWQDQAHLLELDPDTGSVDATVSLPQIPGIELERIETIIPQNNQLVLVGTANSANSETREPSDYGAFVFRFDASLQLVSNWNNVGAYQHLNVGNAIKLTSGRIAIAGQGVWGNVAIASVNPNESGYRFYASDYSEDLFYNLTNLTQLKDGNLLGFFKKNGSGTLGNRLLLRILNDNLTPVATEYLDDLTGFMDSYGMVVNLDDSITLLYGQGQNGYNNYDVIVQRIAPIN